MNARRLERIATLLLLLATACTVLPRPESPVHAETRRVVIPGETADTLAETTGPDEGELVPVHTHDGRDLWVRASTLGGATLVPGTWVLLRQDHQLFSVPLTRSLDDFVEVELAGQPAFVPIGDVVARLHHGLVAPPVDPPPAIVTPLPPATPISRMVMLDSVSLVRTAMLDSCIGRSAHVVFPDGTEAQVPMGALHPLRVRAGDHVSALWGGSPYPAIILATRDTLVRARWEDASEQWIDVTDVQSVDATVTGTVHGCPHRAVLVEDPPSTRIGRLLACDATSATVLGSDGTPRTLPRESLARVPLRIGDSIEALWNGTTLYQAFVLTLGERPHVRWSDGTENDIDPATLVTIRLPEARPSEAPVCPDV